MHVVVIGSGLLGLSTAWFLHVRGAEVTVLERASGPGAETSFANGGLLTPSMPEPWNHPGVARQLMRFSQGDSAAVRIRWRALPSLLGWGLCFLRNSSPERLASATRKNALLARYSLRMLAELRRAVSFDYTAACPGTLRIFRNERAMQQASDAAQLLMPLGVRSQRLSTLEALDIEPALRGIAPELRGAIYYCDDESGDAHRFCVGLAQALAARGVILRYGTQVTDWRVSGGQVSAVSTTSGLVKASHFVLAAGCETTPLAAKVGINVPVRPAKGYSITCRAPQGGPRIPVIDDELHAAVVPLGANLRLAGTAEFAGFDRRIRRESIEKLMQLLRAVYPEVHSRVDSRSISPWAGLRPLSADGVPILGATRLRNLFLNTGHGPLGWTMAAGSGRVVADLVTGAPSEIGLADYALTRVDLRSAWGLA